MTITDFYRERFGSNWVVARRTSRTVERYGDDVRCISQKQMRETEREYRREHGDPYDSVRSELYLALKVVHDRWNSGDACFGTIIKDRVRAALEAECAR